MTQVAKVLEFISVADSSVDVDLDEKKGGYNTDREMLDILLSLVDLNTALILYLHRSDVQETIGDDEFLREQTNNLELRNLILKEIAEDVRK